MIDIKEREKQCIFQNMPVIWLYYIIFLVDSAIYWTALVFFADDKPNKYGEQRLYGALGWGIFSFLGGVIIDAHSEGQATKNYISVFYLGAAFLVLNFIVAFNIKVSLIFILSLFVVIILM